MISSRRSSSNGERERERERERESNSNITQCTQRVTSMAMFDECTEDYTSITILMPLMLPRSVLL